MKEILATITSKGQVTIPVEVRRYLDLNPGDQIIFRIDEAGTDKKVELLPPPLTLQQAFGLIQPMTRPEDFKALRDIAIEEHVQNVIEKMKE